MKLKFPLAAAFAAFAALVSLTACGGGASDSSGTTTTVASPATLSMTDTVVGTGAEAATGKTIAVTYTGWLYSATATDHKGTQFDSGTFIFTVGSGQTITGFDQGVLGMKVGGTRTIYIPSSMGYGATGYGTVPANAGLVFDVALTAVQ